MVSLLSYVVDRSTAMNYFKSRPSRSLSQYFHRSRDILPLHSSPLASALVLPISWLHHDITFQ